MRALLDINVLIALLDPDHVFHERAHTWWGAQAPSGWASCPLTENGVVRIMSHPAYSPAAKFPPADLIHRLDLFASQTNHEFWPDNLTLRDQTTFARDRLHTSRALTDIYLLALAVKHQATLATFDQSIPLTAVPEATPASLCII